MVFSLLGLLLLLAILFITIFVLASPLLYWGAPYYGCPDEEVAHIISLAEIGPGVTLVDLGSGDGRIVIAAALAGATAVGYEVNPYLVWLSRQKIKKLNLQDRAKIAYRSLWKADLSHASVVVAFLLPHLLMKYRQKIRELPDDSLIATIAFPFEEIKPEKQLGKIFIYTKIQLTK